MGKIGKVIEHAKVKMATAYSDSTYRTCAKLFVELSIETRDRAYGLYLHFAPFMRVQGRKVLACAHLRLH